MDDVWDDPSGTWLEYRAVKQALDHKFGQGNGMPALLRRLALDQIGVQASGWHYWMQPTGGSARTLRRAVLRNLFRALEISEECQVKITHFNEVTGDFEGEFFVTDNYDGTCICDGEGEPRYLLWAITGLHFRKEDVEKSFGLSLATPRSTPKISEFEVAKFIAQCGTENSKEAWRHFKTKYGPAAPKRDEVFMVIWRKQKGNRGQGRIAASTKS